MVSEGARGCQMVPESARGCQRVPDGTRGCQMVSEGARGCQMIQKGARGCQMVPESARECQRVPDGASGCQMVPEGARGCQRSQIGTVVARGLGKASELIFFKVSIAGVEVVALVDTGATTSCCRWDWYQKWKDHLGALIKSKVRIIGVGHDPIKVKGLTRPLTLHWDGVGGKFQLMILTALTDVDVVLGMDVLSQLDVKIDFKKKVASPAREPCTSLEPAKTVGLLLNKPAFTFKGKIPVKEEEVEEVVKGVPRQGHRELHRVWMASEYKINTKDKRKDCKIVRESSMPWDKAGYKAQLQRDLKDIRQKLSRVLGQVLDKSTNSFVEATSLDKCIEGSVLVDLCMQRSGKRGSGCDAPKSADRFPKSSDGSFKASEGFPTPVTSPPRPPAPPAAQMRQYSCRKYVKKEVCVYIRTLKPLKTRKEKEELKFKRPGSTNRRNHSDVMDSDVITPESNGDVTMRDVNKPIARKRYAPKKHSFVSKKGFIKSLLRVCSRTFTKVALMLAMVISILGGLFNIKLHERKSTIGTSSSLSPSKPLVVLSFLDYSDLSSLGEFAAAIIGISEGLWSRIHKVMFLENSKQLTRCMKILQNMIICRATICTNRSPSSMLKTCAPYYCSDYELASRQRLPGTFWRENVWLHIYSRSRTSGLSEYII